MNEILVRIERASEMARDAGFLATAKALDDIRLREQRELQCSSSEERCTKISDLETKSFQRGGSVESRCTNVVSRSCKERA